MSRRLQKTYNKTSWRTTTRREVLRRFAYRCAICGIPDRSVGGRVSLHIDHRNPWGGDNLENLWPLCPSHSASKDNRVIPRRRRVRTPNQ